MRTIIKFNQNTPIEEMEAVIQAAVKKYVVKNDRYSTPANSGYEITEENGSYYVTGKRINSHVIELEKSFDDVTEDDIFELTIDTYNIGTFNGYVDRSEFYQLVTVKEDTEVVENDKAFMEATESIKNASLLFGDDKASSDETAHEIIEAEKENINQLKEETEMTTIQTEVKAKKELWDSINNIEDFVGLDYDSSGRFMEDGEYTMCWGFSSIDDLNRFLSTDWTEFLQQADVDIYSHSLWLDATPTFNDYN